MIQGWLSKNEEKLLAHFAKKSNGRIVEIGSFQGKSTVAMAKVTKNPIYAIDPHYLHSYTKFLANTKKYKNVIPIKKTSTAANRNWREKISLLHIDGAHEYRYAKEDLKLWLPHLESDGVVVCHDAFAPYPEVFWAVRDEIFAKPGWAYVGVSGSQIFAIRGKRKLNWQRPFIILASNIWHNKSLSENLRFFIVNRLLKIFFLNKLMLESMLWKRKSGR